MRLMGLAMALALAACGATESNNEYDGPALECDGIEADAQAVLDTHCARCHNPQNASGGFDFVADVDRILDGRINGMVARMKAGTMPPAGAEPRPSPRDIAAVETWRDCSVGASGGY